MEESNQDSHKKQPDRDIEKALEIIKNTAISGDTNEPAGRTNGRHYC